MLNLRNFSGWRLAGACSSAFEGCGIVADREGESKSERDSKLNAARVIFCALGSAYVDTRDVMQVTCS